MTETPTPIEGLLGECEALDAGESDGEHITDAEVANLTDLPASEIAKWKADIVASVIHEMAVELVRHRVTTPRLAAVLRAMVGECEDTRRRMLFSQARGAGYIDATAEAILEAGDRAAGRQADGKG